MIYFQSLTRSELVELLKPLSRVRRNPEMTQEEFEVKAFKQAKYRAQQVFHWVYQRHQTDWDQMSDLSKDLRSWLKENVEIYRLKETHSRQALDGTHKFLWQLVDGKTIESVIIPAALQEKQEDAFQEPGIHSREAHQEQGSGERVGESKNSHEDESAEIEDGKKFAGRPVEEKVSSEKWGRLTACISSQVGCAMACKFCLTGVQGLDRHLQTHEIVTQVYELRKLAPITNIVFMGMGEPLHNFENVVKACEILLDQDGLNFSKRKVTVSTSGLVPAIEELGKRVDVSLAVSLNGTTDEQRSLIMPVNKKWNIEKLLEVCRKFPLGSHRRITFEYVMLQGLNDSLEDAARLVKLTRDIPSKINLIPFNEHSGSEFKRPTDQVVRTFQRYLLDRQITATVRISRGRDILAACGQLRSIFGTARGTEKHKDWAGQSPRIQL
jgi:23S rRNA (adenine2503-C2)-methyltransferase